MEKPTVRNLYRKWFDMEYPLIGQIRSGYNEKKLEEGIPGNYLADAVLTLGDNEYLVVHDGDFWDKGKEFNKYRDGYGTIILDTADKWKRFGDQLDLNRSNVTIRDSKKYRFVPERKMGELYDENRKRIKLFGYQDLRWDPDEDYRGVGWWGATTKVHHIVLFDAFVEGQLFADLSEGKIRTLYDRSDIFVEVESRGRGKKYPIKMITTPTSLTENWFYTEWQDIKGGGCPCPDAAFRELSRRKRMQEPEFWEKLHKYTKGEFVMCTHWVGTYTKKTRDSRKFGKVEEGGVILVDLFPFPKNVMFKAYDILKNRSVKLTDKGYQRLTKADIGTALGKIIAHLGGFSNAFIFRETPYSDTIKRKQIND
ncbi:MAG: hypothetical protein GTN76_11790 [Candidatus Aenigmarchaeota archaeon]|nr:hypothetical protein [Candidatus Aenigmarchaeota archaeon]